VWGKAKIEGEGGGAPRHCPACAAAQGRARPRRIPAPDVKCVAPA
jgi:hypothetical protein